MQLPFRAYTGGEPYVFISYAHADAGDVYPEIYWLQENTCNVWYDEGIAPGHGWRDQLAKYIDGCSLFILYLSSNSVESEHCMAEISYALDRKVPILAIFMNELLLPQGLQFALQNRQALQRFQYNQQAYRVKLREGVVNLLGANDMDTIHTRFEQAQAESDTDSGFDRRYGLHREVSRGPDGLLVRAVDYVRGRSVTIKRDPTDIANEISLAKEFENLALLHHPNIVKALDFGIEKDGRQYLVLDLQDNDVVLARALVDQPVSVQVDLLSQALRVLHHLHSKQLTHNAIQMKSIVINDGRLKLLDFALCRKVGSSSKLPSFIVESSSVAPERKQDFTATETADLYALGSVFYQALVGSELQQPEGGLPITSEALQAKGVDSRMTKVLSGLLAPEPGQRFQSVLDAFAAFDNRVDAVVLETALTRESTLQSAQFVGRDLELGQLQRALDFAKRGQGGTVLISGESGVGKSRLLGELERISLLEGFRVMHGHSVEGDTGSYRVWDQVTQHLDLLVQKAPNAKKLAADKLVDAGRNVDEYSFLKLEASIRKQHHPTLIILEDLHWAGTESVKLLSWVAKPVQTQPVLIVGTYRPNEAFSPGLLAEDVQEIKLSRLSHTEVAELATVILGEKPDAHLKEFLAHETEGNSLFIIETLRALAEHAGALDQVESSNLPASVLSGGMLRVLTSRLSRLESVDLELLRVAAVIGREINPALMSQLEPHADIDAWTRRCLTQTVLEESYPSHRFSHEKLRSFILDSIDRSERLAIHKRVAEQIETVSEDLNAVSSILARHWSEVGDANQEVRFSILAGEHTLAGGALLEAVEYFRRAEKLLSVGAQLDGLSLDPEAVITEKLSEAYYRLGNLAECDAYSKRAIVLLGAKYPRSTLGMGIGILVELTQVLLNRKPNKTEPAAVFRARVYLRLLEVGYYSLKQIPAIWSSLRAVNAARAGGAPEEMAQSYALTAPLASAVNLHALARGYALKALSASRTTRDLRNRSYVNGRLGSWAIANCDWPKARTRLRLAQNCARQIGDLRLLEENTCLDALVYNLLGEFGEGLGKTRLVQELAQRVGDRQIECWGAHGEAIALIRLGRSEEARTICTNTLDVVHDPFLRAEAIATHSILALIDQRADRPANAKVHINEAMQRLEDTPGISWWVVSALGCLMEAVFTVPFEDRASEKKIKASALKRLKSFSRTQPLGEPLWALWSGVALVERGKTHAATNRLTSGRKIAKSRKMLYEVSRIDLELAKLGRGITEIDSLANNFKGMGCRYELDLIRSLNT